MLIFEYTLALLLVAVVCAGISRRVGVPYPTFLALVGAALAFLPNAPSFTLAPDLTLALFVAPVLLDAAYDTSLRDLKDNWAPVGMLVLVAVAATTVGVAAVAHALVPGLPWAAAVALGAIVAPPDAAAATAVLRSVRLPYRVLVILEGESLLNDASALLIYRIAVGATLAGGTFSIGHVVPTFALVVVGSLIAGFVSAKVFLRATRGVRDIASSVVLQFVGTFGIWILAERAGLSGILTVVTYGMTIARSAPTAIPARIRVPSYAVWDVVTFVANVLAFLLIGLQLGPIVRRLSATSSVGDAMGLAAAVLAATILIRVMWVMGYNLVYRWKVRRFGMGNGTAARLMRPSVKTGLVISWSGMRGIITLAGALALPTGDANGRGAFPHRDLLVFAAFAVVLGTLVIQGLTLKPLLRLLKLRPDATVEREVDAARRATLNAAVKTLDGDHSPAANALRNEYEEMLRSAQADADGHVPDHFAGDALRRRVVDACRAQLASMRGDGSIGDAAYHMVEEDLDLLELAARGTKADDAS